MWINNNESAPDEFTIAKGKISIDSPLARALLKKQVDDERVIQTPQRQDSFFVEAIRYEKPSVQ
jgi:transcription elongation factor GreB